MQERNMYGKKKTAWWWCEEVKSTITEKMRLFRKWMKNKTADRQTGISKGKTKC